MMHVCSIRLYTSYPIIENCIFYTIPFPDWLQERTVWDWKVGVSMGLCIRPSNWFSANWMHTVYLQSTIMNRRDPYGIGLACLYWLALQHYNDEFLIASLCASQITQVAECDWIYLRVMLCTKWWNQSHNLAVKDNLGSEILEESIPLLLLI